MSTPAEDFPGCAPQALGRLLVVGGGVMYKSEGLVHLKKSLALYLAHLSRGLRGGHWIGARTSSPEPYQPISANIVAAEARSAWLPQVLGLAWERCNGTGRVAAILHLPNLIASLAAPFLHLFRIPVVVYFANDWWRETAAQFSRGRPIRGLAAGAEIMAGLCCSQARFGRNTLCNQRAWRWRIAIEAAASLREEPLVLAAGPTIGTGSDVLFVGKLEASKGLNVLLEAFAIARLRLGIDSTARLLLAGQEKQPGSLDRWLAELGLDRAVVRLGFLDDQAAVLQLMDRVDLVCVTSIAPEGFPRVVEEASSRGKPLLVADNPSLADLLAEHGGLLSYPANDAACLAGLIVRVLEDETLRHSLARGSLDWARGQSRLHHTAADQHHLALAKLLDAGERVI